eukprot:g45028.t1
MCQLAAQLLGNVMEIELSRNKSSRLRSFNDEGSLKLGLERRRLRGDLIEVFKIISGLYRADREMPFPLVNPHSSVLEINYCQRLQQHCCLTVPGTQVRFRPQVTFYVELAHSPRACVRFLQVLRTILLGGNSRCQTSQYSVGLSAGTILFLVGLATVTTGYLVPPKIEGIGEADFLVVDRRAIEYNEALEVSKLVGAILFSMGGTAIA